MRKPGCLYVVENVGIAEYSTVVLILNDFEHQMYAINVRCYSQDVCVRVCLWDCVVRLTGETL